MFLSRHFHANCEEASFVERDRFGLLEGITMLQRQEHEYNCKPVLMIDPAQFTFHIQMINAHTIYYLYVFYTKLMYVHIK